MLTVVASDGGLWALPECLEPTLVHADIARGSAVTDLAWSPTAPELLLVRRETRGGEPYDSLIRVDLRSGQEEIIEQDVGPQARLSRPSWGPDGQWGIARLECCLSRELVRFSFPTGPGSPNTISANQFLSADAQEVALAEAGFVNPQGEIVMSVQCCLGDEPAENPAGLYAIPLNFQGHRKLASGEHGTPIGAPADNSWLATLAPIMDDDGHRIVLVRPDGTTQELPSPTSLPLSDRGQVLPDGAIAVASVPEGVLSQTPRYMAVWAVSPSAQPRNLTEAYKPGFTAFAFASSLVVQAATSGERQLSGPTPAGDLPRHVFFSGDPQSHEDFTVVFLVARGPLTPDLALRALIQGPTADEASQGYFSELGAMLTDDPTCPSEFDVTFVPDVAIVSFCGELSSTGIGQDARVTAQITATLTQFPGVRRVRLLDRDGHCLMDMSGEDRCLRD